MIELECVSWCPEDRLPALSQLKHRPFAKQLALSVWGSEKLQEVILECCMTRSRGSPAEISGIMSRVLGSQLQDTYKIVFKVSLAYMTYKTVLYLM